LIFTNSASIRLQTIHTVCSHNCDILDPLPNTILWSAACVRLSSELCCFSLLLALPLSMRADTTYTYTGNAFISGPLAGDSISVTLTLPTPLGDNLVDAQFFPESYSISVGGYQLTGATSTDHLYFWTDASGNITQWLADASTGTAGQSDFLSLANNITITTSDFIEVGTSPSYGRDWPRDCRACFMPWAAGSLGSMWRALETLEAEAVRLFSRRSRRARTK
jgi:hypothetical protein